ncbi:hypothetical protein [Tenacibaculum sp. 47A_GOM-205m]|uniref:hypothetical protein n=1 Tax=Tenacibaculum sp. 47A_GOM-205m TaxID=1380384 RepID=UPI00048AEB05|nr:hypothetical protein [Tenacibaculum sp. 47A_GOM-205m]
MVKNIIFIFLILTIISCKKEKIDGIIIGDTLFVHLSVSENRKMVNLINQALKKDKNAIIEITNFPNGGAASSYDLGYVLTQIIYRIGENEFADILRKTPKSERNEIEGLIAVGLEYGDNDYDGKMDEKRMETEFPKLTEILNE